MEIIVEIHEYSPERGLHLTWQYAPTIVVQVVGGATVVKANSAGLRTLASHLLTLAQSEVPAGRHIHYDDSTSLEDGSSELILERMD
jgi:hypothetical protein